MMIGCGYVQNFFCFFLPDYLYTYNMMFLTPYVNTYLLIMSILSSLSTILYFSEKLISLYLFLVFFREKTD